MSVTLRAIGAVGIVIGLILASYTYLSPGLEQQAQISGYESSTNKDAYDRSHPGWRSYLSSDERADQLVSVIYGLGIALISVGLVQVSYKIEAKAPPGAV